MWIILLSTILSDCGYFGGLIFIIFGIFLNNLIYNGISAETRYSDNGIMTLMWLLLLIKEYFENYLEEFYLLIVLFMIGKIFDEFLLIFGSITLLSFNITLLTKNIYILTITNISPKYISFAFTENWLYYLLLFLITPFNLIDILSLPIIIINYLIFGKNCRISQIMTFQEEDFIGYVGNILLLISSFTRISTTFTSINYCYSSLIIAIFLIFS